MIDCVSLYPSQSNQLYPVGKYEIISDLKVLRQIKYDKCQQAHFLNNKKMIGLAQVSILTPTTSKIPLFGLIKKDTYIYGCCKSCIMKKQKKPCRHGIKNRAITATICWNELNFAVSQGYILVDIYECYQYEEEAPIFKLFFNLLSREKIRHSNPDLTHFQNMNDYVQYVNSSMQFPPNMILQVSDIMPHAIKRQHCKQDLNMVFGKLSQQNMRSKPIIIKTQAELDKIDLRMVETVFPFEKSCILIVKNTTNSTKHNRRANSILYSYVLAYSRIHMLRTMTTLQAAKAVIFQISNDAIYFTYQSEKKIGDLITLGPAFGSFRDEYPNAIIHSFVSFGSKSCSLKFTSDSGDLTQIVKARGFRLSNITAANIITNFDFEKALGNAIQGKKLAIKIPQIRKRKLVKSLSVKQLLLFYQFSNCISETRIICDDGSSQPYGFIG